MRLQLSWTEQIQVSEKQGLKVNVENNIPNTSAKRKAKKYEQKQEYSPTDFSYK